MTGLCGYTTEDEFWRDPDPTPTTLHSSCTSDMTVQVMVDGVAIAMMDKEGTAERIEGKLGGKAAWLGTLNRQQALVSIWVSSQVTKHESTDQIKGCGSVCALRLGLSTRVLWKLCYFRTSTQVGDD